MHRKILALIAMLIVIQGLGYAESKFVATKVDRPPIVDGKSEDSAWAHAQQIITHDKIANLDIALKSVYTEDRIYFLVQFPDLDESRLHKPWLWNSSAEMYEVGPEREDCFVFKWAMETDSSNLSVTADEPHSADIWFWKANRTDPVGYADDKIQRLSKTKLAKSKQIKSQSGKSMFIQRKGDKGQSAYKSKLYLEHSGDEIPQFEHRNPTESRADVRAKGFWKDGSWCVEFSRLLVTGNPDDIQLDISKSYFFGVSRYEIAGREPNPSLSQPLYGAGDVSEKLMLTFSR